MDYAEYKTHIAADVAEQIKQLRCQPVLFAGSGISRRYFDAPNWGELLKILADRCPLIDKDYGYYAQSCSNEPQIASIFADKYREWAWGAGKNQFPAELFEAHVESDSFLKHTVAAVLKELCPSNPADIDATFDSEIKSLRNIQPHAIITTNYDSFLELLYPDHAVIVGQSALKGMPFAVGEIFKFHGCVSDISQMVLTSEDYENFQKKKKFIAARLLSLFNEHPLVIVGYSANDSNVRAILSDIDEALGLPGTLIENIYFVEYDVDAEKKNSLPTEKLIQIEDNRSVRVKLIVASDLDWVYQAFKSSDNLHYVPPGIMRAILARSYELVRTDIPRTKLKVDFDYLERKLNTQGEFAQLFGITTISDGSALSAMYPYSLTELAEKLGGSYWFAAQKLIDIVARDTGVNIKAGDNKFHQGMKHNTSGFHRYSDAAYDLLKKVQNENACDVDWLDAETLQD